MSKQILDHPKVLKSKFSISAIAAMQQREAIQQRLVEYSQGLAELQHKLEQARSNTALLKEVSEHLS